MGGGEDYNQVKRDIVRTVIDASDDYPELDNSSKDSFISSINSSSKIWM